MNNMFLKTYPDTWNNSIHYINNNEEIKKLEVVNDTAEREIKLIK